MVARKRLEVDLRDGTGRIVKFDVPVNAKPDQVFTLSQRAIKAAYPNERFQKPVLDRPLYSQSRVFDAKATATPNTLRNRAGNAVSRAARAVGVNDRSANRLGSKAEGIVDSVPVLGEIVGGEDAVDAFKKGNYAEAAVGGMATALGAFGPLGDAAAGATKAMFLGAKARTADKEKLGLAQYMDENGVDRDRIWKETGWGKGADGNWRFETDDSQMSINPRAIPDPDLIANNTANNYARSQGFRDFVSIPLDAPARTVGKLLREKAKEDAYKDFSRGNKVIDGTPLEEAYPYGFGKLKVGAEDNLRLNGSWNEATSELRVRPPMMNTGIGGADTRSTIAHELQHFVQGQEGFARGGMTGTVNSMAMRDIKGINKRMSELARSMDDPDFKQNKELIAVFRKEYDDLMDQRSQLTPQAQIDPYEGYKRLAGEVEARNVQKRLDWSPEMRRAVPPWKTQEYPDDEQFKIWGGDGAAADTPDIQASADGFDDVPLDVGYHLRDVKPYNPDSWRPFNRASDNGDWTEAEVPLRSLYGGQETVSSDFAQSAAARAGETDGFELPIVVRDKGEMFVRDGHHRLVARSAAGKRTAKVRLIDLDGAEPAPLLDYLHALDPRRR